MENSSELDDDLVGTPNQVPPSMRRLGMDREEMRYLASSDLLLGRPPAELSEEEFFSLCCDRRKSHLSCDCRMSDEAVDGGASQSTGYRRIAKVIKYGGRDR